MPHEGPGLSEMQDLEERAGELIADGDYEGAYRLLRGSTPGVLSDWYRNLGEEEREAAGRLGSLNLRAVKMMKQEDDHAQE